MSEDQRFRWDGGELPSEREWEIIEARRARERIGDDGLTDEERAASNG